MLSFNQLALRRGSKLLFEDATFQIHQCDRVGVVGRNGCGKSSLFNVFTDQLGVDAGDLLWPKKWRVALMAQELLQADMNAVDYVLAGHDHRESLLAALAKAEQQNDYTAIASIHGELKASVSQSEDKKLRRQNAAERRKALAPLKAALQKAERAMAKYEKALASIEEQLTDTTLYDEGNKTRLQECLREQADNKVLLESTELERLKLQEEIEAAEKGIVLPEKEQ